jgi:hypothetical protein
VVAASGFQKGALVYAKTHGIACVRLVDGAWTYETRDLTPVIPQATGHYVSYARHLTDGGGYGNTLLSDETDHALEMLFREGVEA